MKKKNVIKRTKYTREELIKYLLNDKNIPIKNEAELFDLLVEMQVSYNVENERLSFGQRMADKLAEFAGSWGFIISFSFIIITWIITNLYLITKPFDAFPFILLNLVLSCIAAIQAPIIMMSQNRQEDKDRERSIHEYEVNLKTELMLESLYKNLNRTINKISKLEEKIEKLTHEVEETQDLTELLRRDNRGEIK